MLIKTEAKIVKSENDRMCPSENSQTSGVSTASSLGSMQQRTHLSAHMAKKLEKDPTDFKTLAKIAHNHSYGSL